MSPEALLAEARRLVDGGTAADGSAWARSAALLGRQALEAGALRALQRRYPARADATFRARFLALRAVCDPVLAADAHHTWAAMSRACHHHGYALPPTAGELVRWLGVVERVVGAGNASRSPSHPRREPTDGSPPTVLRSPGGAP